MRMKDLTIMTGFNDPTSLQVPYAPLSAVVLPEARKTCRLVGNPAVADYKSRRVVFMHPND